MTHSQMHLQSWPVGLYHFYQICRRFYQASWMTWCSYHSLVNTPTSYVTSCCWFLQWEATLTRNFKALMSLLYCEAWSNDHIHTNWTALIHSFLRSYQSLSSIRHSPPLMIPDGSKQPNTGPYPQLDEFSPHFSNPF
jgi:hypothetical protein